MALKSVLIHLEMFQHTAARRRLPKRTDQPIKLDYVSTHSRPKAAAYFWFSKS